MSHDLNTVPESNQDPELCAIGLQERYFHIIFLTMKLNKIQTVKCMGQLSRCSTARWSVSGSSLRGPTKVKALSNPLNG